MKALEMKIGSQNAHGTGHLRQKKLTWNATWAARVVFMGLTSSFPANHCRSAAYYKTRIGEEPRHIIDRLCTYVAVRRG